MASTQNDELYKQTKALCRPNWLKEKMVSGGLGWSFGMTLAHSAEIVHLAKVAGYTALLMNLEHQRTDIGTATDMCCAALNLGVSPIIIVPECESTYVSRVLDNGAQGVICPRVGTAEMAERMVEYSKYRPLGKRPLAMTPQMQYQIPHFQHTMDISNENTLTVPMIETLEGLDNCEAIASVKGVDMLFIGAFDLSDEMGIPGEYDNPKLWDGLTRICKAATAAGIFVGIGGLEPRPDLLEKICSEQPCVRFVMAGRDLGVLLGGMTNMCSQMKKIENTVFVSRSN